MTKEKLIEWGLTEDQANKVMEGLNGSFVTKTRFNEVNTELKNANDTIKERDTQLETLKKSTGDVEALNKKITELQTANAEQKKQFDAERKADKISNAVEAALIGAKAKNTTAVKALMAEFLGKAELADDGTVKGLADEVKKLVEGEGTAFLFDKADPKTQKQFKGAKAAEKSDTTPAGDDLSKMSYEELCQYMEEHPEATLE